MTATLGLGRVEEQEPGGRVGPGQQNRDDALTHNCTTAIWHHQKAVGSGAPLDWRLLANGYLVDLAYERGSVDTSIGLDELKRRSDITERARGAGDAEDFSKAIRAGLPPRVPGGST